MPPQKPAKPIVDVQPPRIETHAAPTLQSEDKSNSASSPKQPVGVSPKPPRPQRDAPVGVIVLTILAVLALASVAVYLCYRQNYPSRAIPNPANSY